MDKAMEEIISKLPAEIGKKLSKCPHKNLQEIRFRTKRPAMLYYSDRKSFLGDLGECDIKSATILTNADIEEIVANFCRNSVYAFSEDIKGGFITLSGGHRVGIGGRAVKSKENISNIAEFSSVNIRIAREFYGVSKSFISFLEQNGRIKNTVIISPPACGKTTLLRDIARSLGNKFKVTIVDERFEIAAVTLGVPQFDVGIQTDVLSGFSKQSGITHALRSLSPDVIICDEIGTQDDVYSIENILKGGCKIITSMHGYSIEEAIKKKKELMSLFEVAVMLKKVDGKPEVEKCINL